jgi:hypothetical protein
MDNYKLKLKDCCLTLEQAKELSDLGIDIQNSIYSYVRQTVDCMGKQIEEERFFNLHVNEGGFFVSGFEKWEEVPTLTNSEMLEMLPNKILKKPKERSLPYVEPYDDDGLCEYLLEIDKYRIRYCLYGDDGVDLLEIISSEGKLFRDALFEMIKYLRENNTDIKY